MIRKLKRLAVRCKDLALWLLLAPLTPITSRLVKLMATTGIGTKACLRRGALPILVDFYSPIPDIDDLANRDIWSRRSELPGIKFRAEEQEALLLELAREYGSECRWPRTSNDPSQFCLDNPCFSFGCAAALHCCIRKYQPRRVIEVGSGNSSLVISEALRRNADDNGIESAYTVIDPYPGEAIRSGLGGVTELVVDRVELTDVARFDALDANDILFVDSGHAVKTGGDVNFLVLDVLPRLRQGVIVHFHDIPIPHEYEKAYFTNPRFRVFWTEAYLLQAFLALNDNFEVMLAMRFLMNDSNEIFGDAFPNYDPAVGPGSSGSFWIRRSKGGTR